MEDLKAKADELRAQADALSGQRDELHRKANAADQSAKLAWAEFYVVDRQWQALQHAATTLEKQPYPDQYIKAVEAVEAHRKSLEAPPASVDLTSLL